MWESIRRLVQTNELQFYIYGLLLVLFFAESLAYPVLRLKRESLRELISNVVIILFHNLGKLVFLPPLVALYIGLLKFRLFEFGWSTFDFVVALVLVDFTYYVHHRSMHRIGVLWTVHAVHHQPRFVNLSMATRLSFFNKALTYWFYLPLALVGVPLSLLAFAGLVNGFYQALTHSRTLQLPSALRFFLIDSRDHHLHHSRAPEVYDQNFGGMFAFWDRLFGSRAEQTEIEKFDLAFADGTAEYGLPGEDGQPGVVNNPVWANLYPVLRLGRSIRDRGVSAIWTPPRVES